MTETEPRPRRRLSVCAWAGLDAGADTINHVFRKARVHLAVIRSAFPTLVKLMRTRMTVTSAVTFLAAVAIATSFETTTTTHADSYFVSSHRIDPLHFVLAYAFVLITQFATHAVGDAADVRSDALNITATPMTGGSRALLPQEPSNEQRRAKHSARNADDGEAGIDAGERIAPMNPRQARLVGYSLYAVSAMILFVMLPSRVHGIGSLILLGAHAYGSAPFLLNHRGYGEIEAAIVTNILLPWFGAAVFVPEYGGSLRTGFLYLIRNPEMLALIVPSAWFKTATILLLNLADRRPDFAAGKMTLAVQLGDRKSARAYALMFGAGYASSILLPVFLHVRPVHDWLSRPVSVWPFALITLTLPFSWSAIVTPLLDDDAYKKDRFLAPSLLHSGSIVLILTARALAIRGLEGLYGPIPVELLLALYVGVQMGQSILNAWKALVKARNARAASYTGPASNRNRNALPDISPSSTIHLTEHRRLSFEKRTNTVRAATEEVQAEANLKWDADVVIVGAGIAGLAAAATLQRLGLKVIVLERRDNPIVSETGADLALWPGAISVLRELGVDSTLFERDSFPLDAVRMCKMQFGGQDRTAMSSTLTEINMRAVTESTGERFVLVSRSHLVRALQKLVNADDHHTPVEVIYGASVEAVVESESRDMSIVHYVLGSDEPRRGSRSLTSRLVIGADGARSKLRKQIVDYVNEDTVPRSASAKVEFCGEVCYRGVLDLDELSVDLEDQVDAIRTLLDSCQLVAAEGKPAKNYMQINYGAGLRSSFGYMNSDRTLVYWWVKQVSKVEPVHSGKPDNPQWPPALQLLLQCTPEHSFYMHSIEDSQVLPRWSTPRIVLTGDSAHTVTPNMGQGACQAIEDAFVLAVYLRTYWGHVDGHIEAFYRFEQARKPYASAVKAEARVQLKLGQLRHPLAVAAREAMLRNVPPRVLEKKLRQHNFDVQPYVELFRQFGSL